MRAARRSIDPWSVAEAQRSSLADHRSELKTTDRRSAVNRADGTVAMATIGEAHAAGHGVRQLALHLIRIFLPPFDLLIRDEAKASPSRRDMGL